MIELKPGYYGYFEFVLRKKGIVTPFSLHAQVIDIDGKYILLLDNDDVEYLPRRTDIKTFEAKERPY